MEKHIDIAIKAEKRKTDIEENRALPSDIIDQVKSAGLVKRWATQSVGGEQASVLDVSDMIADVAYYNGSLAWVIGVTGCSSLFSGFLDLEKAKPLFEDPLAMIGGFAGPSGMAIKVKDGLKVTGHWTWGSGISHCTHIVGGVMVMEGEKVKGTAIAFFEPHEVEFIDNWHVLGLKGTNSIDYKVSETIIPDVRWSWFPLQEAKNDDPLYRFSFLGALSVAVASVGLGLAHRATEEIKKLAIKKSPFGMGKPLSKKPEIQKEIGRLEANYLSAKAILRNTIKEAQEEVKQSTCSIATKARIRMAAAQCTALSREAVQAAYQIAGGSAVWESNKLSELMKDMNMVTQHGMVSSANFRTTGAVSLGNEVPEIML